MIIIKIRTGKLTGRSSGLYIPGVKGRHKTNKCASIGLNKRQNKEVRVTVPSSASEQTFRMQAFSNSNKANNQAQILAQLSNMHLRLRKGVASPSCVEALPDTILLSPIRPNDCLHFLQGGIATMWTEQTARLLNSPNKLVHDSSSAEYVKDVIALKVDLSLGCMCIHHVVHSIGGHLVP